MRTRNHLARLFFFCALLHSPRPCVAALKAWANDGADKVPKEDLRLGSAKSVLNHVWDGHRIRLSSARNEVVAFTLILEAHGAAHDEIRVSLPSLRGPDGYLLESGGDAIFDWRKRQIELFFVRYLAIEGVSRFHYEHYDERHVPSRFRRPWSGEGAGAGTWLDRPDHGKRYPEIAVPLELHRAFSVPQGESQSVWIDIFVPKDAPPGKYEGTLRAAHLEIPVELTVRGFALPDVPSAKTMLYYSMENVHDRYLGTPYPPSESAAAARKLRDRHFLLAHRHKLSLIDDNCLGAPRREPCPEWIPRLDGSLFTATNGYAGPGEGEGNGVFSIGTYGRWTWKNEGESGMRKNSDAWVDWFDSNFPKVDYFLYLIDESLDFAQTERWASWLHHNPGPGRRLRSLATIPLVDAIARVPSLDLVVSTLGVGVKETWESGAGERRLWMYNGARPASGSFGIEDDGVALPVIAWAQHKKRIERWFQWESTYYNDFQANMGKTNVFRSARTFGKLTTTDASLGKTGWNYSNGEGVLFYPGTDKIFPEDSYDLDGPIASLRLKHWRRGIQDADYLALAEKVNPEKTRAIVDRMIPKVLWEYGASDPADPSWVRTDISWPTDPAAWAQAREELASIIATSR